MPKRTEELTLAEAAQRLGKSVDTVRRMIKRDQIDWHWKEGAHGREYRVTLEVEDEEAETQGMQPMPSMPTQASEDAPALTREAMEERARQLMGEAVKTGIAGIEERLQQVVAAVEEEQRYKHRLVTREDYMESTANIAALEIAALGIAEDMKWLRRPWWRKLFGLPPAA